MGGLVESGAVFSEDLRYRYVLTRGWDVCLPTVAFIGLNPSTADESKDDPTIRKCVSYAKRWGFGRLVMLNLFALRATDPAVMLSSATPIGPHNDHHLLEQARKVDLVVAAWGNHGAHMGRGSAVREMIHGMKYLRATRQDQPGHPLYLPGKLEPKLPEPHTHLLWYRSS